MISMKDIRKLKDLDRDDVLELIGLQQKSNTDWIAPALSAFAVGLLVGAGVGLLMAQKPGNELRNDLRQRLSGAMEQGQGAFASGQMEKPASPRPL